MEKLNRDSGLKKIMSGIIIIFFFLVTFIPRSHSNIKLPLMVTLLFISLLFLMAYRKQIYINKTLLIFIVVFISYGVYGVFIGSLYSNNTSALLDYIRLYLLWGMVYGIFSITISNTDRFPLLFKVLETSNLVIAVYNLLIYLNAVNITNLEFLYSIDAQSRIGLHDGYVQITSHNLGTLIFTTPFLIALFLNEKKKNRFRLFNILLSVFVIFLSGRRAALLNIALTPVIIFGINLLTNREKINIRAIRKIFVTSLFLIGTIVMMQVLKIVDLNVFFLRFLDAFKSSENNVRSIQISELMKGFSNYPLFGSGFGKGVESIVRDSQQPWSYEVILVSMLYNTGIIGMTVYIYSIYLNLKVSLKTLKNNHTPYMFGLLVGYINFLIANFTNPYLASFDFTWILFIIVAYYNYLVRKGEFLVE